MSDEIKKSFYENQEEEAKRRAAMYEENVRMLQTEERFQKFFEGYHKDSIALFIKWYATIRVSWHLNKYNFGESLKSISGKDYKAANGVLALIYIKKVFNLKCRWIAGEMDLQFITCSVDFDNWYNNQSIQKYIGPITQEEVECMIAYRKQSYNADNDDIYYEDFLPDTMLKKYHLQKVMLDWDEDSEVPGWFQFYDKHFGTGPLMDLPLIRKELEVDYLDLWKQILHYPSLSAEQLKVQKKLSRKEKVALRADPEKEKAYYEEQRKLYDIQNAEWKKYVHLSTYNEEQMNELMKLCETNEIRSYYNAERERRRRDVTEEELTEEFKYLGKLKHNLPIQSYDDFREGIRALYWEEKMGIANQQLRFAYRAYCETLASGKPFNWEIKTTDWSYDDDNTKWRIIQIRQMLRQPENFDFLKKENLPPLK